MITTVQLKKVILDGEEVFFTNSDITYDDGICKIDLMQPDIKVIPSSRLMDLEVEDVKGNKSGGSCYASEGQYTENEADWITLTVNGELRHS